MKLVPEAVREAVLERSRRARLVEAALSAIGKLADIVSRSPDLGSLLLGMEAVESALGQASQDAREEMERPRESGEAPPF